MTDGTYVEPDELRRFSKGAHDRAQDTIAAANAVDGVHLGYDMLGLFSAAFLASGRQTQAEVASKGLAVAATLSADGAIATSNADDFDDNNTTQANQFKNLESR